VFRTAGLYLIGAWVALQVANVTFGPLGVPDWVNTLLIWAAIIGFPVTVVLGWRYELGPGGLVLTRPRTGADDEADPSLQRSDYLILTLVAVVVSAAAYGLVLRFSLPGDGHQPLASRNRVAVLPFVNMSTDRGDQPLGDALSDELRDQLSLVPGVDVVARGSSLAFRDQEIDVRLISNDLDVAFIVTGRITPTVVSVELIEGRSGVRLWSEPFERRGQALFTIQQSVLRQVVARIAPGAETALTLATSNVSAHEALLLARQLDQEVRDDLVIDEPKRQRAIELYRQAIALDPRSALAHSRLGALLLYGGDIDEAVVEVDRALSLDNKLSEAHYTQALYLISRRLPGVRAAYERAVELGPNNAEALAAYAQWAWGNIDADAAGDLFRRALDLDPLSLVRFRDYGEYLASLNHRDEVLELAERVGARFPDARGYFALARLYELIGEVDVAIAWARKALELQPTDDTAWYLAELYAEIGDFENARAYEPDPGIGQLLLQRRYPELIELAQRMWLEGEPELRVFYSLCFAYIATGNFEIAADVLESLGIADSEPESWSAVDAQARVMLVDAKYALGQTDDARRLAQESVALHQLHMDTGMRNAWWPNVLLGCALAAFDRDAEVLDALERIDGSLALPQLPVLLDSHCFQRFKDEPRYRAVIANIERRQKQLRERLPDTLRSHGVLASSN